jgi:diguanylate cyclase
MLNDMNAQTHIDGRLVLGFLEEHALTADPIHYWVAHEYLVGANEALTRAVRAAEASGKPLDAYLVRQWYDEHVGGHALRQMQGMSDGMARLFGGLLENLREADRQSTDFQGELQANISELGHVEDPGALQEVAQNLLKAAMTANVHSRTLQKNLEDTEKEARQLRAELETHRKQSLTDPLTGLLNRRGMELEMGRYFLADVHGGPEQAEPAETAMLVLDIDHFKRINDHYGHAVGDVVLRRVAEAFGTVVPEAAIMARFGGEEFVVLVPETSQNHALGLAERIRQTIEKMRLVRRQDKQVIAPFTISVGLAMRSVNDTVESLFERADQALYKAKNSGRNRVVSSPV